MSASKIRSSRRVVFALPRRSAARQENMKIADVDGALATETTGLNRVRSDEEGQAMVPPGPNDRD